MFQAHPAATSPNSHVRRHSAATNGTSINAPTRETSLHPTPVPKRKRTERRVDLEDAAISQSLKEVANAFVSSSVVPPSASQTADELFGQSIGKALASLTPHQSAVAKMRIEQVLLEVQFGSMIPQYAPRPEWENGNYQTQQYIPNASQGEFSHTNFHGEPYQPAAPQHEFSDLLHEMQPFQI